MSIFTKGYALVVGVGADLPNTVVDAKGFAEIVGDPERCAYPADQIQILTEDKATRTGIVQALDRLAATVDSESTVLFYFSGHGYTINTGIGKHYYLMPYNYDIADLVNSAISAGELMEKLKNIKAQKMLVLLDCCYAGGIDNEGAAAKAPGAQFIKAPLPANAVNALAQGQGRVIISSCKEHEVSYTGDPYSEFTQALVEAMAGAERSTSDGYVRAADLALYAAKAVPQYTKDKQHPDLHFNAADNFVVAYYAAGDAQPKGLPERAQRKPKVEESEGQQESKPSISVQNTGSGAVAVGEGSRAAGAGGVVAETITGDVMTGANARKIQAERYVENDNRSVFNQTGQKVYGAQSNIGGNLTVGNDFVGRDKITVGDIKDSSVAIGSGSRVNVNSGLSAAQVVQLMLPILDASQASSSSVRQSAATKVMELQTEAIKGKQADDSVMASLIEDITDLVPGAVSAVVSAFASPLLAGLGGAATKYVLKRLGSK